MKEKYTAAALELECADIAQAAPGGRNNALFVAAAKLGQLVSEGLSESAIFRGLMAAAEANGLVNDDGREAVANTIRGGIDRGKTTPRVIKPNGNHYNGTNISILNMQRRMTRPALVVPIREPMVAAAPDEARVTPDTFPAFTPPNADGKPKFGEWPAPVRWSGEIRRHDYYRGDAMVMVNIKWRPDAEKDPQWTPWFRVVDGERVGWQAKRPRGFRYVPYFRRGDDPFAPGDTRALAWCEGEKDADTLSALGFAAFSFGASTHLPEGIAPYLVGRDVLVFEDNDESGRKFSAKAAAIAATTAATVKVVALPDLAESGDVTDWIEAGHTGDDLRAFIANMPDPVRDMIEPAAVVAISAAADIEAATTAVDDDDAELNRLAALSVIDYERERKAAAEKLGVRPAILDTMVKELRPKEDEGTSGQGRAISFDDPEPWPDRIDGAALLSELSATVRRHVVMSDEAADAVALWIVHTYLMAEITTSPKLGVFSPEKQCGKTTCLDLLGALVCRPLATANVSTAALFRVIEMAGPTLMIDEADTFLKENEELRGVLNSGHRRHSAFVLRTVGEDHEPRMFSTWAAVVIAMIGRLPPTLEDRSIPIALRRKRPDETISPLSRSAFGALRVLTRKLVRWTDDNGPAIAAARPEMPPGIYNRQEDNWSALLAVADIAGGEWPSRARAVAVTLTQTDAPDDQSIRVHLLGDIRAAFDALGDKLGTKSLIEYLTGIEERPWGEWKAGKPITPAQLARLLGPFKVIPVNIKTASGAVVKGYRREDFADAFERYLPQNPFSCRYAATSPARVGQVTHSEPLPDPQGSGNGTPQLAYSRNDSSGVAANKPLWAATDDLGAPTPRRVEAPL